MATRILLIEDEPLLISLYRMVLERANYHVDIALNATIAEEKILSLRPHVVLLDLLIPRSDVDKSQGQNFHEPTGFEILRLIKGNPTLRETRVIVLSNLDSDEHVATAKKLGADDYVIKASLDPHHLKQKVDRVLHSSH